MKCVNSETRAEFSKLLTQNSLILHHLDAINLPKHFAVDFCTIHVQFIFHFHLSLPNNSVPRDFPTKFCMLSKYVLLATCPVHSDPLNFIFLAIYVTYINHYVLHYVIPKIFIIILNQTAVQRLAAHVRNICPAVISLRSSTLQVTL